MPQTTKHGIHDWNAIAKCKWAKGKRLVHSEARVCLDNVFRELSDICPLPDDNWYKEVFANYDESGAGTLDHHDYLDIVEQYYTYHYKRNLLQSKKKSGDGQIVPINHDKCTFKQGVVYRRHDKSKKIWEDYDFLESTGKGSFGSVDIVVKKTTGQKRACKTIVIGSEAQSALVSMEIELMEQLNHPNILRLHETYTCGNVIHIVMEYCEGGQLFDKIVDHYQITQLGISERKVAKWMKQILSALAYIHKQGIAHRDIKPENLLFLDNAEDSSIKLIDFGLSTTMDSLRKNITTRKRKSGLSTLCSKLLQLSGRYTPTGNVQMQRAGTPHYMSPEMIKLNYDVSCDVFAIGIVLFQLLSGDHPFYVPGVDTEKTVRAKIISQDVKLSGGVWDDMAWEGKDLCSKLLHKNPKKRISAFDAMHHPWFLRQDGELAEPNFRSNLSASVFDGLNEWRNMSSLKQAVLHLLASRLSENEITDLRHQFLKLDVTQTGVVTFTDLKKVASDSGLISSDSDDQVKSIINSLDFSGTECIGYNEFISALLAKRRHIDDRDLRELFQQFDTDHKGFLSIEELTSLLSSGGHRSQGDRFVLDSLGQDVPYISLFHFMELMRN